MDIKTFKNLALTMDETISILIRGPHGIGKSQCAYQLGEELGLPVKERRLSQMTEGDMIGLPKLEDDTTKFCPPDWFMECVREPHVLFLDEINRATPEVMQAAFQLVLDRELNGVKIHPECRILTAINASADYQVNEMDPALLDRFAVVDLEPSLQDWLTWAKGPGGINPIMVDFIKQNPRHLEHKGQIEPNKVYPSRRSWERVHKTLDRNNLYENAGDKRFYQSTMTLCGPEAAIGFVEFVKNYAMVISAEDILDRFSKFKKRIEKGTNEQLMTITEKLCDHAGKDSNSGKWTDKQAENVAKFFKMLPDELLIQAWTDLSEADFDNSLKVHPLIQDHMVEVVKHVD